MEINIDGYFGEVLQVKRRARGFTQKALADSVKLDRTYISMLERGLRKPSLEVAINIAKILDVPAAEIVSEVEGLVRITGQNK